MENQATQITEVKVETRGRKVNPNSPRQIRLAQQAENRAMGIDGRGRHVDPESARQAKLNALEAKRAAGIEIKRGRPKGTVKITVENKAE